MLAKILVLIAVFSYTNAGGPVQSGSCGVVSFCENEDFTNCVDVTSVNQCVNIGYFPITSAITRGPYTCIAHIQSDCQGDTYYIDLDGEGGYFYEQIYSVRCECP